MADRMSIDYSELDRLTADLGTVQRTAGPNIRKAVEVTARNIKDAWRDSLKGSATLPGLPAAVGYDVGANDSLLRDVFAGGGTNVVTAEIGFDKDRNQGALGNISEYGTPTITGRGFGLKALDDNAADFERGLNIALEQTERSAGL